MTCTCGAFISRTFLTTCVSTVCASGQVRPTARSGAPQGGSRLWLPSNPSSRRALARWRILCSERRRLETAAALLPTPTIWCGFHSYYLATPVLLYARHWAVGCKPMIAVRADARLLFHWEDS
jgi:hypothetical protein